MKVSFRPSLALLVSVVTFLIFFLALKFSSLPVFLILLVLWMSFLSFVYFVFREQRKDHTLTLTLSTALSSILLFSVIDDPYLRYFFAIFVSSLFGILFAVTESESIPLGLTRRPFRRFVMMVWVFNAYAFFSCLFALGVLFLSEWPASLEFILVPSSGIIAGLVAGQIWKMYVKFESKTFLFWQAIMALFISEIFWSISLLPFGYLVSGILLVWLWYAFQMLIRFHFQASGIIWKKQLPFLIVSAIIFLFLGIFFVRWI